MFPIGASPAPSALSVVNAFGLTQQIARGLLQVPLKDTDWPATAAARRVTFTPFRPTAWLAVAVSGDPVWECMIALHIHPFRTPTSAPVKWFPHGDSSVNVVATMWVASKATLP